ncbi:Gfo/Idh/MocA family protein [Paenibacillus spongiae]|uniref:Gfo/Idh/MocA family oxidoreductase n=1 Tax=Paenibacillus spongiae TaxID=2909671 RepID=A0ABY5S821_9BACL|nr:Gfo/Idh/MocA family oxidoreductase [Paenibacillus spongiae]UVI30054.1 Gfo/Idh/MocA family oxidoreductase [Paenibacillus spongiae]
MGKIRFGIIGGGWRAEFYLRIAAALPERFEVARMLVRREEKGAALTAQWGIRTVSSMEQFVRERDYSFAVVSVSRESCPDYIAELASRGIPVLAETPPAKDLQSLVQLFEAVGAEAKVQVAEQYLYQPMHAARIAVAHSGKLGSVSHVQVSAAHGYHGISLIRRLLGVRYEDAVIRGERFTAPLMAGPGRGGPPQEESFRDSVQDMATLRFGGRTALYDFAGDQYFSWVRKNRVLVRGDRGEIADEELRYLVDYRTPVSMEMRRVETGHNGNLEGYYHQGILAGSEWVYRNPFIPARLTDDEIAIATSLANMARYAEGGPSFYSLAEASQDHYLSLMMAQAVETGETVRTTPQIWSERE